MEMSDQKHFYFALLPLTCDTTWLGHSYTSLDHVRSKRWGIERGYRVRLNFWVMKTSFSCSKSSNVPSEVILNIAWFWTFGGILLDFKHQGVFLWPPYFRGYLQYILEIIRQEKKNENFMFAPDFILKHFNFKAHSEFFSTKNTSSDCRSHMTHT